MISAKAKVCGIMAYPVEHSLSPLMHNFYAEQMGIDFVYVPFKVQKEQVKAAIRGAYALNLTGMNVTVPHKQTVIPYLKELDSAAKSIGAVNTLVRTEGGYKGYNTDASGFLRAIKGAGIHISGQDCLLIGAGGAAKAVAYILGEQGAASVIVLNRNEQRAWTLAQEMNQLFKRNFMTALGLHDYGRLEEKSWLAIQTTTVGMHPDIEASPVQDKAFYKKISVAMDVIYTPAKTQFMTLVEEAGGRAISGLDMLIYQGIEAFELWNPGQKVSEEIVAKARQMMEEILERQTKK
ncbi:MAG: shikimate dehydrogenase [Hungatella sp.]|nr:shikimate dehydrogenase [Hungatella sp.]